MKLKLSFHCVLMIATLVGCGPSREEMVESKFRSWGDSDFEHLVSVTALALRRVEQEGWKEGTIPEELKYLDPERVLFHDRGFTIETYVDLDSSAGLIVVQLEEDEWEVCLFVNEHDKPEVVWRGSVLANKADHSMALYSNSGIAAQFLRQRVS